jgi:hypothetical protein
MRIILEGGHYDGDRTEIDDRVWQLTQYGNIYRIVVGEFIGDRQVFRFDEKATLERKHRKPEPARGNADLIAFSEPRLRMVRRLPGPSLGSPR